MIVRWNIWYNEITLKDNHPCGGNVNFAAAKENAVEYKCNSAFIRGPENSFIQALNGELVSDMSHMLHIYFTTEDSYPEISQ